MSLLLDSRFKKGKCIPTPFAIHYKKHKLLKSKKKKKSGGIELLSTLEKGLMKPFRWDTDLSADLAPFFITDNPLPGMHGACRKRGSRQGWRRAGERTNESAKKKRKHVDIDLEVLQLRKVSVPDLPLPCPPLPSRRGEEKGMKAKAKSRDLRRCRQRVIFLQPGIKKNKIKKACRKRRDTWNECENRKKKKKKV